MTYASYSQELLEDLSFIGGNDFTLLFSVTEPDGVTPLNIGGSTIKWVLSPYGQPEYTILQISGVITGLNSFSVKIPSLSSRTLSGNFIHQPIIIALSGTVYRPAQGICVIKPAISYT